MPNLILLSPWEMSKHICAGHMLISFQYGNERHFTKNSEMYSDYSGNDNGSMKQVGLICDAEG